MSTSPVARITKLVKYLPTKDISFAEKFITVRDFESLKELVDSAIFKVKKSQNSATPKEEYSHINLPLLEELKGEIDSYLLLLGIPDEEVFHDEDWGDEINTLTSEEW